MKETMERLSEWLAAARADVARREPDPMIEHRLLARTREQRALRSVAETQPTRRAEPARARRWQWFARPMLASGVAIASILLLIGIVALPQPQPDAPMLTGRPFLALVSSEAIAAERSPFVVESKLPRAALADYGLPVDPARVDEPVGAEFLLSHAGVVLAVRFKE
jgi:hypothetical protein